MPRSPRDRSGPAQPVTISLSPRHRERLAEMAAQAGTSKGVVVEKLIDRSTAGASGPATAIPDAPGYKFPTTDASGHPPYHETVGAPWKPTPKTFSRDPKAGVEPRLKKGSAK